MRQLGEMCFVVKGIKLFGTTTLAENISKTNSCAGAMIRLCEDPVEVEIFHYQSMWVVAASP